MMDWTDRHCRWFHRRMSKRVWLYTEMVVADAIIHGDKDFLIAYNPEEHPVALQIGGSDPTKLAKAAKIGEKFAYDEVNINIGCPSDRVQSGRFGACLMSEPDLVAQCYSAMSEAVSIPVTVKCRLGIDDQNLTQTLPDFIETVSKAGCQHFIIHARKAWLKGLSPKENRDIPPLDYELVRQMKREFPQLSIVLNGGLTQIDQIEGEAQNLDGAMYGRAAYNNPWMISQFDNEIYRDEVPNLSRSDLVADIIRYAERKQVQDRSTKALIRHITGLYSGQPGARLWRRSLSEGMAMGLKPSEVIIRAANALEAFRQTAMEAAVEL